MAAGRGTSHSARFARAKFRPPALPATLIIRPELHERLTAGADQRLTVVTGSGGRGQEGAAVELDGGPARWHGVLAAV